MKNLNNWNFLPNTIGIPRRKTDDSPSQKASQNGNEKATTDNPHSLTIKIKEYGKE